jgi:hypothetical protein
MRGVGTGASLFAAALLPGRLRSLVIGTGGATVPLQLGGVLKEWMEGPSIEPYRKIDGRQIVIAAIGLRDLLIPLIGSINTVFPATPSTSTSTLTLSPSTIACHGTETRSSSRSNRVLFSSSRTSRSFGNVGVYSHQHRPGGWSAPTP